MATTYKTAVYATNTPAIDDGVAKQTKHLHATSGSISTWAANDVIYVGALPKGAVVTAAVLKASAQIDSNGSPTLTLDLGVVGTTQLFKAAITTVGRSAGVTADATIAAGGLLYKTTADIAVLVTVHAAAATANASTLEVDITYFVEHDAGSNP